MDKYGLLGWPVKHSVSPQMQEAGFRAAGIAASYELLPVPPDAFAERVKGLCEDGFAGWNITVPHKGAMLALLDEVTPAAKIAGSVNTVVHRNGRLHGYSTDGYGLEMSIRERFGLTIDGGAFLFWGTGGAARATACHFAAEGAAAIHLANRTVAKAEALAEAISEVNPKVNVHVHALADEEGLRSAFSGVDCVIQCTSVGLHEGEPVSIPIALLEARPPVLDMIYRPTPLLAAASELGCPVADGRDMLLYQGVKSWSIWTGQEAPVEAMRAGLDAALDG